MSWCADFEFLVTQGPGDVIVAVTEWGEEIDVTVPDSISPGETFDVLCAPPPAAALEESVSPLLIFRPCVVHRVLVADNS